MKEDTSFVSLSLEKYNELYDKAKKYDELFACKNEETAATAEVNDEELNEIKVGDKVRLVDIKDQDFNAWFRIGDICRVVNIGNEYYTVKNTNGGYLYNCEKSEIEKINEREEN